MSNNRSGGRYSELRNLVAELKFRVIIVGGGASGLATAYKLALEGERSVAVLEQGYACSGASTRNAAHFRVHFWAPENVRFAMKSLQKFREFASETRRDFEVRREGYLWLLTKEEEVEAYKRTNNQLWSKYRVAGKFLSPEEMAERYPYLNSEGFIAGFLGSQDGKWNPNLISLAYYEKAQALGVRILTRTETEKIIIENGKVKGVQTNRGSIEAEKILVAAGAWTNEIMKTADVALPIEPEKKEIGVTEPINYFIGPLLISLKNNSYVGQMTHGEVIGSIDYPIVKGLGPEENTLDWFHAYADAASKLVPMIKNLMLLRSWMGYYIMAPDNSHIMGRESEWPENLYVATGYSGHGFVMSHLVGEVMARNLLYDEVDHLMEPFLPSRFREERLIKEEMVIG